MRLYQELYLGICNIPTYFLICCLFSYFLFPYFFICYLLFVYYFLINSLFLFVACFIIYFRIVGLFYRSYGETRYPYTMLFLFDFYFLI